MRRITLILTLMLLGLGGLPAHALEVHGLYEAQVSVPDQGRESRQKAIEAALEEVLIKVSGYSAVLDEPALKGVLGKATGYVQQYRYRTVEPEAPTDAAASASDETPSLAPNEVLWVRFDKTAINRALQNASLPIWSAARPNTLAWIAIEQDGQRRLVGASEAGPIPKILQQRATERGLPLVLPLLDLQDQAQVRPADVWGNFQDTVAQASKRYQAQAMLLGRVYRSGGVWQAEWNLYLGSDQMHWSNRGATLEAVLDGGIDGSADNLSSRLAQIFNGADQNVLDLEVNGVNSLADYSRLLTYLKSVSGVVGVGVTEVSGDAVQCRLQLEVGTRNVVQTIALGSTLESTGTVTTTPDRPVMHEYRLLP